VNAELLRVRLIGMRPFSGRGQPVWFLGCVITLWIGIRMILLYPQIHSVPDAIRAVMPFLPEPVPVAVAPEPVRAAPMIAKARISVPVRVATVRPVVAAQPRAADPMRVQLALLNLLQFGRPEYVNPPSRDASPLIAPLQQRRSGPVADRWSGSAWLVARPGTGIGAAPDGSQLGGSQAGVRIAYIIDPSRRIALYGRFATPLSGKGREAAFGVDWQPTRLPVRLIAEERIDVDSGRTAPGVGLVAGWDGKLGAGFRLESYGQAGAVSRDRVEPYADGAARATRQIARQGPVRLSLGVGAWGAAQRDAQRLDVGPSATAALPLGGQQVRVSVDWRQRVAGDARPGSGLALTIGSDF
jgi:hypothetical protein